MEKRLVAEYLGLNVITDSSIPHSQFVYFNIHNSLLDSSMGTPIPELLAMIERAKNTGTRVLYATNNIARTVFAVPYTNVNTPIFQGILQLCEGIRQMAELSGKTLSDLFDVRGLELQNIVYECEKTTVMSGNVIVWSKDFSKKLVDLRSYSVEELLQLTVGNIYFGLKADEKINSADYQYPTKAEFEAMLKDELIEICGLFGIEVPNGALKSQIVDLLIVTS